MLPFIHTDSRIKMIQTLCFLIFVIITGNVACATPIGYIYNASYVSNDIETFITYKDTCSECICNAFFLTVLSKYISLNCYTSNKTCALFANYSTPSSVEVNLDSTFIFMQQPPSQNETMSKEICLCLYVLRLPLDAVSSKLIRNPELKNR
jgi:hypothetical protein